MKYLAIILLTFVIGACTAQTNTQKSKENTSYTVVKTEAEWKEQLTAEEYHILREKGTERAWTGEYNKVYEPGTYTCKACDTTLFTSSSKFDSGSGWPSFDKPINNKNVITETDESFGMSRTEIKCGSCGGHLGHVFNDGPTHTGLRYCVNSLSLTFKKK